MTDWIDFYANRQRRKRDMLHYVDDYNDRRCLMCEVEIKDRAVTNELNLWREEENRCVKKAPRAKKQSHA